MGRDLSKYFMVLNLNQINKNLNFQLLEEVDDLLMVHWNVMVE